MFPLRWPDLWVWCRRESGKNDPSWSELCAPKLLLHISRFCSEKSYQYMVAFRLIFERLVSNLAIFVDKNFDILRLFIFRLIVQYHAFCCTTHFGCHRLTCRRLLRCAFTQTSHSSQNKPDSMHEMKSRNTIPWWIRHFRAIWEVSTWSFNRDWRIEREKMHNSDTIEGEARPLCG